MDQNLFGHFCWHDCFTSDPSRVRSYYSELLGWKSQDVPIGPRVYSMLMASNDQQDMFGGIEEVSAAGAPSHWLSYVSVDDLDAKLAAVTKLGGSIVSPPTDIPGIGRSVIVKDPTGATFALYRGNQPQPPRTPAQMRNGLPCWMELFSADPAKSTSFFTSLFGWQTTTKDLPDGQVYTMMMNGSAGIGGVMKTPMPGVPSQWYPYFLTDDLESAAKRAASLGGKTIVPPSAIGDNMGSFAIQLDPMGAMFGFYAMPKNPTGKGC